MKQHPIIDKLRSAAARTTRVNAEAALLCEAALEASDWIESLVAEIDRLNKDRLLESYRLDWLMCKIPGDISRALLGEISDTSSASEWLEKLDAAAGINKSSISRSAVRAY